MHVKHVVSCPLFNGKCDVLNLYIGLIVCKHIGVSSTCVLAPCFTMRAVLTVSHCCFLLTLCTVHINTPMMEQPNVLRSVNRIIK